MPKEDFTIGSSKVEDFWKFINARHEIYLKRKEGLFRPWTNDPIFLEWKFTNVFRELDRGTIAIRQVLKQLYTTYSIEEQKVNPKLGEDCVRNLERLKRNYIRNQFITCILYRMFNWKGNAKFGPIDNPTAWYKYLESKLDNKQQIIGDTNSYQRKCTLESYIEICRQIVSDADDIILQIRIDSTLEHAWCILKEYDCVGPFIAYEFVCDLRYTDILRNATDTCTWCNIGLGAERGLKRLGLELTLKSVRRLFVQSYNGLRGEKFIKFYDSNKVEHWIERHFMFSGYDFDEKVPGSPKYPYWELREIEHCLCEFDKYERIRLGQGRPSETLVED